MYIKEIDVENLGPLEKANIKFNFNEDGSPKPLIFVGKNGSGKSTLISNIIDSFYEFAAKAYSNIQINDKNKSSYSCYYKILSPIEIQTGKSFLYSHIVFDDNVDYLFALGKGIPEVTYSSIGCIPNDKDPKNGNISFKRIAINSNSIEDSFVRDVLSNQVIAYFPPDRYERPNWLHRSYYERISYYAENIHLQLNEEFSNEYKNPITVNCGENDLLRWLLDIIADSRYDLKFEKEDGQFYLQPDNNIQKLAPFITTRDNVQKIISAILGEDVEFGLNPRSAGNARFCIIKKKDNEIIAPSLSSLSSGQIALFKMFATLVKYADSYDIQRSCYLSNIKGIVVIDEIELHLHPSMQADVLPKLIELFPKVQFIITTHSPLFLLGMDKVLGKDSYDIIDLPSVSKISTETFSEFVLAFKYYEDTSYFEKELQTVLSSLNLNENTFEPLIITEGQTDWMHLESAYRALLQDSNNKDLFSRLGNIKFYEFEGKQKSNKDSSQEIQTLTISDIGFGKEGASLIKAEMGDSALLTLCETLSKFNKGRIIIFIFDHDKEEVVNEVINGNNYKNWGNNVYSFAIPVPESRQKTPLISIEHYYSDDEIKTVQKIGENDYRLFMGIEFDEKGFFLSDERRINLLYPKKNCGKDKINILDGNCVNIVERRNGKSMNVALSKYRFAWNILKNEPGFNNFDFSNFIKIFEMIRDIIEHHNS